MAVLLRQYEVVVAEAGVDTASPVALLFFLEKDHLHVGRLLLALVGEPYRYFWFHPPYNY